MKTVGVTEFKARCLSLVKEVEATGEGLTITVRGRPVADVAPHRPAVSEAELRHRYRPGQFADLVRIVGDIEAPLDVEWEALTEGSPEARRLTTPPKDERAA